MPKPDVGKLTSPVLRGLGDDNIPWLPDSWPVEISGKLLPEPKNPIALAVGVSRTLEIVDQAADLNFRNHMSES